MSADGSAAEPGGGPPAQVRLAGVLVGVETLAAVAFAVLLLVDALAGTDRVAEVVAQGALFLVLGAGMAAVTVGLLVGRRWARSPAVVIQFLLLPVIYSLIGPSRQVALGLGAGVLVVTALVLLLSQPAKQWVMDR